MAEQLLTSSIGTVRITPAFKSQLQYTCEKAGVRQSDLVRYSLEATVKTDPKSLSTEVDDWKAKQNGK